jgi:hypothetical protein
MKPNPMKKTIALLMLGGLFAANLQAQQVNIHITGSTAFRANNYRAIRALYGSGLVSQNPADPASSKNQVTWTGTMTNIFGSSQTVNIYASYSGSIAGVQALVQGTSLTFLSSPTNGSTNTFTAPADLAFSDVYQAATPFTSTPLVDALVAIQPFVYVKSQSANTVSNVTMQQLQVMLGNGSMPLSYFTGKTNDDATLIYMVGRNNDSGTRLTSHADDFFTGTPQLYQPDTNCNWGLSAGFSSGSGVVGALTSGCGHAIGYLGLSDAETATTNGCVILTYNGFYPFAGTNYTPGQQVATTPDFTPVYKGQYSYWSYEHLFELSGAVGGNIDTFRTALIAAVDNDIATLTPVTAIRLTAMKVSRPSDGGPIAP